MNISNIDKAKVLTGALPYIQAYWGKTIVVKYGGNAMINEGLKKTVIEDLVLLSLVGIKVVLVHGGGPEITDMAARLGIESRFVNGLRYTDDEVIDVVQMVLAGKTNKDLVNLIGFCGGSALGLSGIDGGMLKAAKLEDGDADYGYVGELTQVNIKPVTDALEKGYIPVIATMAYGERVDCSGYENKKREAVYNINADTAAAEIAAALGAEKLVILTDIKGLMHDPKDEDTLIPAVSLDEIDGLISEGVITGGMIPKVECCRRSIEGGVKRTHIIDGRIQHSILIEMLSDEGVGTMFTK